MRLKRNLTTLLPSGLTLVISVIAVNAQATEQLPQKMLQCAQQADKQARLVCYDNLTQSINTNTIAAKANNHKQTTSQVVEQASHAKEEFGLKIKTVSVDEINAAIIMVKKDPYGAMVITLDNGQIWKQTEPRRYKLKVDQQVIIKKAALGSYSLGVADRNAQIKVKRIK